MKNIITGLIIFFSGYNTNAQTLTGGNALLGYDGGGLEAFSKNWFTANNRFTGNRSHLGQKYTSSVSGLASWSIACGVLDPVYYAVDSLGFVIDGPGQTEIKTDAGVFIHGNLTKFIGLDRADTEDDVMGINSSSGLIKLRNAAVQWVHTPSSSSDTGTEGQLAVDASYIYICTATNTWKRIALSSF